MRNRLSGDHGGAHVTECGLSASSIPEDEAMFHRLKAAASTLDERSLPRSIMNLATETNKSYKAIDGYLRRYPARKHLLKIVSVKGKGSWQNRK